MMGTYEDVDWAWVRALTRQRRIERALTKALLGGKETLRVSGTSTEFCPEAAFIPASSGYSRRTSKVYRRWKLKLWREGKRACHYCGTQMTWDHGKVTSVTVDHKQPINHPELPGDDEPWNWALCCWLCNNKKGALTEAEYRALLERESV